MCAHNHHSFLKHLSVTINKLHGGLFHPQGSKSAKPNLTYLLSHFPTCYMQLYAHAGGGTTS